MSITREKKILKTDRGYEIPCLDGSIPEQRAIIICLHGFGGSKRSSKIERLHEVMTRENVGTFTFDWPAHGESRAEFADLTVENCLSDLEDVYGFVKKEFDVPIWCFATSFGGYLAVLYIQRHPENFEKVMLRSPALKMAQIMRGFMNEEQFSMFMDGAPMDFGFDQPLILKRDAYDDLCAHDAFTATLDHPERMMIIHGDKDDVVPPEDSKLFAERSGIKLRFLEGANHMYERPGDTEWVMDRAKELYD